jgi:hypothetical protein
MKRSSYRSRHKFFNKRALAILLACIVALSGIAVLELTNTTHWFHKKIIYPRTASQDTKGEAPAREDQTPPADQKSSGQTAKLVEPYGNFVSNHHPNLDGSPAPSVMQSICTTTPGALCTISFTKDGVTKSLPEQRTDSGGAAYWNWNLQDVGLSEGSWQIQAKATLGSQTASAQDAINLEVSP